MPRIVHSLLISNGKGHSATFCLETDLVAPLPVGSHVGLGTSIKLAEDKCLKQLQVKEVVQEFGDHAPNWTANHTPGDVYMILGLEDYFIPITRIENYSDVAKHLRQQGWYCYRPSSKK